MNRDALDYQRIRSFMLLLYVCSECRGATRGSSRLGQDSLGARDGSGGQRALLCMQRVRLRGGT